MADMVPVSVRNSFNRMRHDLDRVMNNWGSRLGLARAEDESPGERFPMSLFSMGGPAVDLRDTATELILEAEMPGLDKDDFTVELEANRVILRGQKESKRESKDEGYYMAEMSSGSFRRVIPLPQEVDPDSSTAKYQNGVLTLRMKKTEASKSRRIPVSTT